MGRPPAELEKLRPQTGPLFNLPSLVQEDVILANWSRQEHFSVSQKAQNPSEEKCLHSESVSTWVCQSIRAAGRLTCREQPASGLWARLCQCRQVLHSVYLNICCQHSCNSMHCTTMQYIKASAWRYYKTFQSLNITGYIAYFCLYNQKEWYY